MSLETATGAGGMFNEEERVPTEILIFRLRLERRQYYSAARAYRSAKRRGLQLVGLMNLEGRDYLRELKDKAEVKKVLEKFPLWEYYVRNRLKNDGE